MYIVNLRLWTSVEIAEQGVGPQFLRYGSVSLGRSRKSGPGGTAASRLGSLFCSMQLQKIWQALTQSCGPCKPVHGSPYNMLVKVIRGKFQIP